MYGAILGDIAGSVYEFRPADSVSFPIFTQNCVMTDDSVLTIAIADALLSNKDIGEKLKEYGRKYNTSYGLMFAKWLESDEMEAYNSYGNGSAMRVSPVAYFCKNKRDVKNLAKLSALPTHNHEEGIKGAYAVALAIFMSLNGSTKSEIKAEIINETGYNLDRTIEEIRPNYGLKLSCQESVPESIIAFLESHDYESAIRNAIFLGGDADTQACIAGSIAEAYYKEIPLKFKEFADRKLENFPELVDIIEKFYKKVKRIPEFS